MLLGVLFSAATLVLFFMDLETRYWDRIATAKNDARSFATILAEYTALTFEDVDRVLLEAEAIRKSSMAGKYAYPGAVNVALRQLQKSASVLVAVGWTDAAGNVVAHSYEGAPPLSNISGRAHFIAQRDSLDDRLFISPPYLSAAGNNGRWLTAASRRLTNADGSFGGILMAPLDQSYFTQIYRSINLGNNGSILLLHRNGQLLAREPALAGALGKSFANGPLLSEHLPVSESGAYETVSVVDGIQRIAGYRAVRGLPLVVLVSFARSDILAVWHRHLYTFGPLVFSIVSIILFGTFVLARQANVLAAKTADLARTNARFDITLSNMSQGVCLFDTNKSLVISNNRFRELYDLPEDLISPGTPLRQILQYFSDRGQTSDSTVDEHVETAANAAKAGIRTGQRPQDLIQRTPMTDGGWVATHEEITEQKRSEELLAEKAAELERMNMRFDAALNNMSQGLCMFDAAQKVVVSNARYGEIYHLSRDQIRPGTSLQQILEYRRATGTNFGMSPEVYLRVNVKEAREVQTLADGRVVAIARHAMPNGGWLTTHEDITDRAQNEKRIAFLAKHDLLTGLANRALFVEKLDDAAKRFHRHGTRFTVLMLDLDKFKDVNDTHGHPAGDQVLVEVARRLTSSLRNTDVLARLGGDEFAIIQENEKNQSEGAISLALKIIEAMEEPFDLNGHQAGIGVSIGIAFAPEHGADDEALLKAADLALYAAKSGGRNDFRIFEAELVAAADIQRSTERELRDAISRDEFELHYQPVIDIKTRLVSGAEAFIRWHHPSRGLLTPDQFLPVAESTGLMAPLGEWILQQACMDAAAWPSHVKLAVNLSAAQFKKGNLFDVVLCALVESGLSPERLELEIGETSLLEKNQAAHLLTIRQLKNLGIVLVLDDCGAGYSSASYLREFPFDKIKIDRTFTQGLASRRDCAAVVASVLALARGLDIATAAKGVESGEQFEALQAAGVDFAQGFLFGRPVPYSDLDVDAVIPLARNVA